MLVDDHCLFRDSLRFVLEQAENINVIAEASDGVEFLELLNDVLPDLVLMDIAMPKMDGIEATSKAISKYPELNIIALSMFGEEVYYHKMLLAGAKGFVLKESGSEDLINAISTVMEGNFCFSKEILKTIVWNISSNNGSTNKMPDYNLSEREVEVLRLVCHGLSNTDIADKLSISQRTVEGHRSRIIEKTGAKNSIQLLLCAIRDQLIVS